MEIESLADLQAAFEEWRSRKRHPREAVPADLVERARQAVRPHGPAAVARATKVDRGRLKVGGDGRRRRSARAAKTPTFSRVEFPAPPVAIRPFAEIETATGLKVRLYMQTDAAFGLITSLCGSGGAR
jgi:hypothetical protein